LEATRLLAAGADPNIADKEGLTPLHFAASMQAEQTAKVLLEQGALVTATDRHGNTPLWTAVANYRGKCDLIALLRAYGADPYHRNRAGRTPLKLARLIANCKCRDKSGTAG